MESDMRNFLIILVSWFGLFVLVTFAVTASFSSFHEQVHIQNCEIFGGKITSQKFDVFSGSQIYCEIQATPEYLLAQSATDITGYHLAAFMNGMILAIYILGCLMIILKGTPDSFKGTRIESYRKNAVRRA